MNKIAISKLRPNPANPRLIKDEKFKLLVQSIQEFPEMLELRPIIYDENFIVLGGNMRLAACKELKHKQVFAVQAVGLTEDQKKEFIIKDNVGFGMWDFDILANDWNSDDLTKWGIDLPIGFEEPLDLIREPKEAPFEIKLTCTDEKQVEDALKEIKSVLKKEIFQSIIYSVRGGEL